MKRFVEQGFFHDLFGSDWEKINLTDDAECAWKFFYDYFLEIIDKHAAVAMILHGSLPVYLADYMSAMWLGTN